MASVSLPPEDKIFRIFKEFDVDCNGVLSVSEFVRLLRACGMKDASVSALFALADADKDNAIGVKEFAAWVSHPAPNPVLKLVNRPDNAEDALDSILQFFHEIQDWALYDKTNGFIILDASRATQHTQVRSLRLRDVFNTLDINKNGKITLVEFMAGLQAFGNICDEKVVSDVFRMIDTAKKNGRKDELLDWKEFRKVAKDHVSLASTSLSSSTPTAAPLVNEIFARYLPAARRACRPTAQVVGEVSMTQGIAAEATSSVIPNLTRVQSNQLSATWSQSREVLPHYMHAAAIICLEPEWLVNTRLVRCLRATKQRFDFEKRIQARYAHRGCFESLLLKVIKKAYKLPTNKAARKQTDLLLEAWYGEFAEEDADEGDPAEDGVEEEVPEGKRDEDPWADWEEEFAADDEEHERESTTNVFEGVLQVFDALGWRQAYFSHALETMLQLDDSDTLVAKLTELVERAGLCGSAKRQGFNALVTHSYRLMHAAESSGTNVDLDSLSGALLHFYECMEDFVDDHKDRALKSAFLEPSRLYFHGIGDEYNRDAVNLHAQNWFLAFLHAALGVQLPLLPKYNDWHPHGLVDFWDALTDECWSHFSHPSNFGFDFEAIRPLKECSAFLKDRPAISEFPKGVEGVTPKHFANYAVDPLRKKESDWKPLTLYLERFAHFFATPFFVQKAFETLNAEVKFEHTGFRRACQTLFTYFRHEFRVPEETLLEHAYMDDYYTELSIPNVSRFFAWLGVVKPTAAMESFSEAKGLPLLIREEATTYFLSQLPQPVADEEAAIRSLFSTLDINGDGTIEEDELLQALQKLDPERWTTDRCSELFSCMDGQKDGKVDLDAFIAWLFGRADPSLALGMFIM